MSPSLTMSMTWYIQGYKYEGGFFLGEFSGSGVATLERDDYVSSYTGEYKLGVRCGRGKQIKVYGDHPSIDGGKGQSLEYSYLSLSNVFTLHSHSHPLMPTHSLTFSWVRYDGQWQEDLQHGRGIFILRTRKGDGVTQVIYEYEGEFVEGVPEGDGTVRHQEGWSYIGQWKHGRCVCECVCVRVYESVCLCECMCVCV